MDAVLVASQQLLNIFSTLYFPQPDISFYLKCLLCTHLDKYGSICQVKVRIIASLSRHQIAALLSELAQGGMPTERTSEPRLLRSNWRMRARKLNHFITTSYLTRCRVPIGKPVADRRMVALFMALFIFYCGCKDGVRV